MQHQGKYRFGLLSCGAIFGEVASSLGVLVLGHKQAGCSRFVITHPHTRNVTEGLVRWTRPHTKTCRNCILMFLWNEECQCVPDQ